MRIASTYLDGAVCGRIWWPVGEMCGKPVRDDLRNRLDRMRDPEYRTSMRDVILSAWLDSIGDFQGGARFTADTEIVTRLRTSDGRTVERRRALVDAPASWNVTDLVDPETYSWDFGGEDD